MYIEPNSISIHTPTKGVTMTNWRVVYPVTIISIHTPTKGVTRAQEDKELTEDISIHTPTKGVTLYIISVSLESINFNPHSHEGSDRDAVDLSS